MVAMQWMSSLPARKSRDLLEIRSKIYLGIKNRIIEILDICVPLHACLIT